MRIVFTSGLSRSSWTSLTVRSAKRVELLVRDVDVQRVVVREEHVDADGDQEQGERADQVVGPHRVAVVAAASNGGG